MLSPSLDVSRSTSQWLSNRSNARTIFSRDTTEADAKACARPILTLIGDPLYASGDLTFHQLAIYICAPCLAVTTVATLYLSWQHVRNYTAPQEQRQILRIIAMPVFYCLFNFLALCWYSNFQYIHPLAGLYQSFAVAALFFLLLEWVCPEGTDRERYFDEMPFKGKKGEIIEGGSLAWFQRTWASIFQFPLITLAFTIIEIVTQYYGEYCSNSFSAKHAHLWLFLASLLIVAGALEGTIAFAKRTKGEMSGTHKERAKIYSFLGIIFFQIIQNILFSLLNGKLFSPTRELTYNDINFGMPALLTCLETVLFSLIFQWSYSAAEFRGRGDRYLEAALAPRLGIWRAVRDALDLSDIVNAVWVALGLAWKGFMSWWNGPSAKEGLTGRAAGLAGAVAAKRRTGRQGHSPFDDNVVAPGPTAPCAARDPAPAGRARTFRHDEELGVHAYRGDEYVPLRGGSRDSSLSDQSGGRRWGGA